MSEDLIIKPGEESPPLHPRRREAPQEPPRPPKGKRATRDRFDVINNFTDFTIRGLARAASRSG